MCGTAGAFLACGLDTPTETRPEYVMLEPSDPHQNLGVGEWVRNLSLPNNT
jgi:hypothetical protein